ncbi:hypothetical protein G9U51_01965 [Calidifontibacter sp. DB0510]|uniref:LysM domain-containing protein n=1 Tax=Metallococcus carri TaxID=1656884 RepID=A0A967AZ86_9MICO|nr:hypothetical protein [Metallococcus carri]NHN54545.1 hypothetical protein [Metallococcus carri]NOP36616.1 hypothetical protein [Calidifontibacter sp. DB2511S]
MHFATQASAAHRRRAAALGALAVTGLGVLEATTVRHTARWISRLHEQPAIAADDLVVVALGALTALVTGWALVVLARAIATVLRPVKEPDIAAPEGFSADWARRIAMLLLALTTWQLQPGPAADAAVAAPVAATAPSALGTGHSLLTAPTPACAAPVPGWTPHRPPATAPADRSALLMPCDRAPEPAAEVVVRRGDCLWSIVERHLGPGADAEQVARAVPRWYAVNRAVIGPDPDLIFPGQVLRAPGPVVPGFEGALP